VVHGAGQGEHSCQVLHHFKMSFVEPAELRRNYAGVAGFSQRHEPDELAERARLPAHPVPPVEVENPDLVAPPPREDCFHPRVVPPHGVEGFEREQPRVLDLILEEAAAH
jgi:hypothetical protein